MNKLFGKWFAKETVHPTVKDIYKNLNPQFKDKIFYGDLSLVNKQLLTLATTAFGQPNELNIRNSFDIYLQVFIRSRGGLSPEYSTPAHIKEMLCARYAHIPSFAVLKCIDWSLEYIYSHEPELKQKAEAVEFLQGFVSENANKNIHLFNLHLQDEDYGLSANKPVFVAGFSGAKEYLSNIVNEYGVHPNISRVGSCAVEGISGPIDMYTLSFDNGEIRSICICNYGLTNSTVAPVGLKLRG